MSNLTPEFAGWYLDEYDSDRFWSKVNFRGGEAHLEDPLATAQGPCWVWARIEPGAYAKFRHHERWVAAHRVAYKDVGNKLPNDLDIDHLCRNPSCVRPSHLEAVSRSENVRRGLVGSHTVCKNGHEMTGDNVRIVTWAGVERRQCVACWKKWRRNAYTPKRATA